MFSQSALRGQMPLLSQLCNPAALKQQRKATRNGNFDRDVQDINYQFFWMFKIQCSKYKVSQQTSSQWSKFRLQQLMFKVFFLFSDASPKTSCESLVHFPRLIIVPAPQLVDVNKTLGAPDEVETETFPHFAETESSRLRLQPWFRCIDILSSAHLKSAAGFMIDSASLSDLL